MSKHIIEVKRLRKLQLSMVKDFFLYKNWLLSDIIRLYPTLSDIIRHYPTLSGAIRHRPTVGQCRGSLWGGTYFCRYNEINYRKIIIVLLFAKFAKIKFTK